jgi:copper resistance protein B
MKMASNTLRLLALTGVGLLVSGMAAAQDHSHMQMPPGMHMDMPMPQQPKKKPAKKPATKKPAAKPAATHPHQHHAQSGTQVPVEQAQPTSSMPMDMPMDGMQMDMPMDHAAMGHMDHMGSMAPGQLRTPIPVLTDADRAAAVPPPGGHPGHDNDLHSLVLFNRLERFDGNDANGLAWEGRAWIGTDLNRVWLRSEGERSGGRTEAADLEVLYGHSISPWWDVVAGLRHDFKPGGSQEFAAFGVQGLAPYKFEFEATGYIGQGGQTAARVEAEYETLLTNRLILQPLVELNAYGRNDASRGIGSGLSTAEAGLRLRYEFTRRFAPYVGVEREWSFGKTADFRRNDGDAVNDTRIVAGFRLWF